MLFSTFDNVVSKLGTEINKIAFTKRSILEKSREYSQVKNDYESGYEYFQKGNSSPKIMKAISEKWKTFQKRYIKEMKSLEKSQTNSQKEVDKILQKNSELAILTLYSKFLTDSQYSKLSINLVKGHKQGLISNDTLINSLQEYRKFKRMDFEKGSVYVKDNRAQYGDMILINDRNEILFLIRNKNDEFEPGKYCLPGGHIDSSENAKAGAVRELEEETGIIVSIDEVIPAGNYIDNKINIHYFTAKYNGDPVVLEEREQIQFEWVPLDKVVDKPLLKNLKENLKEIIDLPKEVINPFAPLGNLYYYGTLLIKSENDQILQRHLNVVCEAYNEGILSGNDLRKALISVPCLSIEYDIVRASNGIKHFVKLVPPKDVLQKGELHGLAFDKTLEEIAEHHKEDIDVIQMQFRMGVEVEMEHTKEKEVAERIAKDHLWETPIYYTKLKEVEKQEVKKALSNVGIDVSDEDWLEKAKYLRRTGVPGNYKYEYDEAKNKKK